MQAPALTRHALHPHRSLLTVHQLERCLKMGLGDFCTYLVCGGVEGQWGAVDMTQIPLHSWTQRITDTSTELKCVMSDVLGPTSCFL